MQHKILPSVLWKGSERQYATLYKQTLSNKQNAASLVGRMLRELGVETKQDIN